GRRKRTAPRFPRASCNALHRSRFESQAERLLAIAEAPFQFVLLAARIISLVLRNRLAAFHRGIKPGEIDRLHFRECLPERRIKAGKFDRETADGLDVDRDSGADLRVAVKVALEV